MPPALKCFGNFSVLKSGNISPGTPAHFTGIRTELIDQFSVLFYVQYMPKELIDYFKKECSLFYTDFSVTLKDRYWMNHCEYCKAKLGDHYLHDEPEVDIFYW